jgi:general secretion pathway protein I
LRRNRASSQRGFTLLEVLVAFFITTMFLGVLYQVYAKGAAALDLARDYAPALAIAESKLAATTITDASPQQGRELDRFDWVLSTAPYIDVSLDEFSSLSYTLLLVEVSVRWQRRGKTRETFLQTLRPVLRDWKYQTQRLCPARSAAGGDAVQLHPVDVVPALFSAGNYQRTSDARLRHNDDKRFVQSFLRRQVVQAVPLIAVDEGDIRALFRGNAHTLRFVGPMPSYQADDGLYLQELS